MGILIGGSAGPTRAAVFLSNRGTGAPLQGVLMFAAAELSVQQGPAGGPPSPSVVRSPLGLLGSDHAGYVSWDLEPLRRQADRLAGATGSVTLEHLWVFLNGPLQSVVDLVADASPLAENLVTRLSVDPAGVYQDSSPGFPAMQSPSLADWSLSPGSFAYMPAELVGADGCETLLPSNVATQKFQLFQIVPIPGQTATLNKPGVAAGAAGDPPPQTGDVPVALVITYDVSWIPVGHGLGQITYSLPLAPGEEVQLAVVDWARSSVDTRGEETTLTDRLDHDELRDRTVSEVVNASIHDWQAGGSIMGGLAAGASLPAGGALQASGAASIGGGYATTTGDRNISSDTVQKLTDQFTQHSTNVRDLRSTVVVQSKQSEAANAQTRLVRNHNHAHALTMLYYEVLRHYRVVVERGAVRPAVLLTEKPVSFVPADPKSPGDVMATISRYRSVLEPGLLLPDLAGGFDAVEKYVAWQEVQLELPAPADPGAVPFQQFTITVAVGGQSDDGGGSLQASVVLSDQNRIALTRIDGDTTRTELQHGGDLTSTNTTYAFWGQVPKTDPPRVFWNNLTALELTFKLHDMGNPDKENLALGRITVVAMEPTGVQTVVYDQVPPLPVVRGHDPVTVSLTTSRPPASPQVLTAAQHLSDDENLLRVRLQHHLANNSDYYNRLIRLNEDPNERIDRFGADTLTFGGQTRPVFQAIENRALDVYGQATAFALDPALYKQAVNDDGTPMRLPDVAPARSEDVISLPTRGVFAEAKLGHCNAAEVIDDSRFWNWQLSPDPDKAPNIADVSTATREVVTSTTPTAFPTSVVTIQQPPAAPDPVALAAAMKVLGQGNIFTDMSTQTEVAALLQALVKEIGGGDGSGGTKTPPGGGTTTPPGGGGGTTPPGGGGGATPPGGGGGTTPPSGGGTTPPGGKPTKQAMEADLVAATALDGPPEHSPQPPQVLTPGIRSVVVTIPPVVYGPGGTGNETGAFSVLLRQDGMADLLADNVRPGADDIVLTGAIDPAKPVALSVNGTTSHYIWQLDASDNLPRPISGPLGWYGQATLTVPALPAVQQSYGFQVVRETATKVVTVQADDLAQGVVGVVAAAAGVPVEQLVSVGSQFVPPAPPSTGDSGGNGGGGISIGGGGISVGGGGTGGPGGSGPGQHPTPAQVKGEVEYFTGKLLIVPAGTGHAQS